MLIVKKKCVFVVQQGFYTVSYIYVSDVLNISIVVQNLVYLCPAEATWLSHSFNLLQAHKALLKLHTSCPQQMVAKVVVW